MALYLCLNHCAVWPGTLGFCGSCNTCKDLCFVLKHYCTLQQVVHRDVKPENIILEGGKPGGRVFLVDFGGVQQGDKDVVDSEVVDTGTLVGTYGYMAPEQLRGSARPASDLFALGGTLLYLLSGLSATAPLFHLVHMWSLDVYHVYLVP